MMDRDILKALGGRAQLHFYTSTLDYLYCVARYHAEVVMFDRKGG